MPMNIKAAIAAERPTIEAGTSTTFYSEVQQEYLPAAERLSRFTGQEVTVLRQLRSDEYDGPGPGDDPADFEVSPVFVVRAQDGTEFSAHVEELNGWDRDLGQFFHHDGTYGPARNVDFLDNEKGA